MALGKMAVAVALGVWALSGAASAQSCLQTAGSVKARELVTQCTQVSPASRPPCNVSNACEMMTDEIQRGCGMYPGTKPAYCTASVSAASTTPAPAGAVHYACPASLEGHRLLNWTMRDSSRNGRVDYEGQADMTWKLTPAQAARGSVRIVCGYEDTNRVSEIPVRQGLRRCLNAEMTSTYDCN